jgi:hypothetical protein
MLDAEDVRRDLENEFSEWCEAQGISGEYTHNTIDTYDTSIEFKDCDPAMRLTPEQQAALWALGFWRCWLCHEGGAETYYYRDDKAPTTEGHKTK